jgi:hypothetical protein
MLEVTLFLLVMIVIAAFTFLPLDSSAIFPRKSLQQDCVASDSCSNSNLIAPVDTTIKHSFLSYLQSEIESALFPRPTDSVLQRHYDTLVNAEMENRLAAMPDS